MQIVHRCPHCQHDLPGWQPMNQQVMLGGWWPPIQREWQRCPVCDGSGQDPNPPPLTNTVNHPCRVCNGARMVERPR